MVHLTIIQQEIKDYPIIEVDINDLKEDPANPNEMTLEQERGLEKSITKFGRLSHIVVDQDLNVLDGAHRIVVEKANGTERINVLQVQVRDEIDRKIIRETLNKLHGTYNKEKEAHELQSIMDNDRLKELSELLGQPNEDLIALIEQQQLKDSDLIQQGGDDSNSNNNNDNNSSSQCPKCGYVLLRQ